MSGTENQKSNARLIKRLLLIITGMFGFVFALVPLYGVFCDLTGLNGKTSGVRAEVVNIEPDFSRTIIVEFVTSVNENMPWDFHPKVARMEVHPGKTYQTSFFARNQTEQVMTGQAIPSITPGLAAPHFKKTECFCFTEQQFQGGEGRDMPLIFRVDPDLPEDISQLTLAYTFFNKQKSVN
ncbi:MAG: cytochrome c oxidase assembly protein [Gammaproteobacteria bacterium]